MADRAVRNRPFDGVRLAGAVVAVVLLVSPGRAEVPSRTEPAGQDVKTAAGRDDKAKTDTDKLPGTWSCVSAVNDGKPVAESTVKQLRLTLTKDRYKTERGEDVLFDSTYTIDAGKDPKQINMIATEGANQGKAAQGIYALDGDTLKICYTMPGKVRPTAFESQPGSAATLVIWKRSKP